MQKLLEDIFVKGKPLKYIKRPFSSVVWSYSEDIQARWEWMFLCQTESKSSLAFIILFVIKPVSTTRVGQSSLTTPVCVRFIFFSFTVVHTISPVTLLYVQNNPDGIHFLLYVCRTWEQKVIIAVVSGTTCLLIAGCSCMFSIVVDIKLTWAERGSSTSAVRVTLYSAVTLFSLLHNSCWPLSLRKPP